MTSSFNTAAHRSPGGEWEVKITRQIMKKTIALSAISAMALTGFAYSQDSSISTDFALSYNSSYVFRGADLGDDLYTYGLDFAGSCDCGFDWSAGLWYGNWDAGSTAGTANSDEELDIYAGVSKDFGIATLELGFVRYIFTDDNDGGNTEIYLKASTNYSGIDFGAEFYWNATSGDNSVTSTGDLYYELNAAYSMTINDKLSAELSGAIGFYDNATDSGFAHLTTTLSLSYAINENISLNPYVAFSYAEEDYIQAVDSDETFVGGVSVGYSF